MIYTPVDVEPGTEVWDVLEGKRLTQVLSVDTARGLVVTPAFDKDGNLRIHCDNFVLQPIKYQAIYPWPKTGKPHLFNCYYRESGLPKEDE